MYPTLFLKKKLIKCPKLLFHGDSVKNESDRTRNYKGGAKRPPPILFRVNTYYQFTNLVTEKYLSKDMIRRFITLALLTDLSYSKFNLFNPTYLENTFLHLYFSHFTFVQNRKMPENVFYSDKKTSVEI